ncbi:hypothetical protein BDR04DRAFT_1123487 [Suillus decipiens]|nr:hypothetical protein BDR04DRAFT_1123487 [Suillus decipiens]
MTAPQIWKQDTSKCKRQTSSTEQATAKGLAAKKEWPLTNELLQSISAWIQSQIPVSMGPEVLQVEDAQHPIITGQANSATLSLCKMLLYLFLNMTWSRVMSTQMTLSRINSESGLTSEDEDLDVAARMLSNEIPTWGDVDDAVSESIESTTTGGELSISSDNEDAVNLKLVRTSKSVASLIRTETGKVKLLDQNLHTRQVIQAEISEVKCHVMFVHGYPELVQKNQFSMHSLVTMAEKHGVHAIKEHLQVDEQYALQLSALVDACIPIMWCELKDDACANIDGYFHLRHKDFVKAKKMTEKLTYTYALKFDDNNDAMPIRNRPYQGELLILLLSNQLFHSLKAVGMKFASRFVKIAKNKLKRPEIPIPFLVLVAMAVYSTLLWKSLSSPGKFNFSGNQFSEVYSYHVKSLEQLKQDAPGKFHFMMADIYEAAHKLKWIAATGDHIELNAFELLDLDGMEED